MNIETYNWGSYRTGRDYEYYLPNSVNLPWKWEQASINKLLEEASMKLGELALVPVAPLRNP